MSGYIVIARRSATMPVGGRMVARNPDEYLVTTRGITGSWEASVSRATVFDKETAMKAANDYSNKRAVAGAPKAAIPDPMGRKPHIIDASGRRAVDATNYFWNTVATFSKVADPGPRAMALWEQIKGRGKLDHVSDYGSQYVIVGDTLYRYADHWGSFATVTWYLSPRPAKDMSGTIFTGRDLGMSIGMIKFSQMRFK